MAIFRKIFSSLKMKMERAFIASSPTLLPLQIDTRVGAEPVFDPPISHISHSLGDLTVTTRLD